MFLHDEVLRQSEELVRCADAIEACKAPLRPLLRKRLLRVISWEVFNDEAQANMYRLHLITASIWMTSSKASRKVHEHWSRPNCLEMPKQPFPTLSLAAGRVNHQAAKSSVAMKWQTVSMSAIQSMPSMCAASRPSTSIGCSGSVRGATTTSATICLVCA